jgi:hypothetical protein
MCFVLPRSTQILLHVLLYFLFVLCLVSLPSLSTHIIENYPCYHSLKRDCSQNKIWLRQPTPTFPPISVARVTLRSCPDNTAFAQLPDTCVRIKHTILCCGGFGDGDSDRDYLSITAAFRERCWSRLCFPLSLTVGLDVFTSRVDIRFRIYPRVRTCMLVISIIGVLSLCPSVQPALVGSLFQKLTMDTKFIQVIRRRLTRSWKCIVKILFLNRSTLKLGMEPLFITLWYKADIPQ